MTDFVDGLEPETFCDVIVGHARERPDAPAFVGLRGREISYGQLAAALQSVALALEGEGLSGRRIGVMLDGLPAALMLVAVPGAAVCVPIDPRHPMSELERAAAAYELDALIVSSDTEAAGRRLAEATGLALLHARASFKGPDHIRIKRLSRRVGVARRRRDERRIAYLMRSSGTTGTPKIIPLTHANVRALPAAMHALFGLTRDDRSACATPLYYAAGLEQTLLCPLLDGASAAIPPRALRSNPSAWVAALRPTWLASSPASLRAMLDHLDPHAVSPLPGVRLITCGGSMVPEPLRLEAERRLETPVLTTYGLTEAGVIAANTFLPRGRKPGTVGTPAPGLVSIRDDEGQAVADGQTGSICVRGDVVMPGYLGMAPVGDGWLPTGDLGAIDAEGFLVITGRQKEMINRGAEKISPYEIEEVALTHPAVAEAAAFGVPHPRLGESAALAVVLRPGADVSSDVLRGFIAGQLAAFKTPQVVLTLTALPRGPTGKVQREALRTVHGGLERGEAAAPNQPLEYQLLELWRRLLRRTDIGVEDDFFAAGGDSLLATAMLIEVEQMTRRRIKPSQLNHVMTVRSLSASIAADAKTETDIVSCVREGQGRPFSFCHGDYSTRGFYGMKLADLMDLRRPVYLLHPTYRVDGANDFESMARVYVDEMIARQPSGPFDLGGFCNGGLLAWEIASQLQRRGRAVNKVLLVETMSMNARPAFRLAAAVSARLPGLVRGGRSSWMTELWKIVVLHLDPREMVRRAFRNASNTAPAPTAPDFALQGVVLKAMADYVPPALAADVYCFTAHSSVDLMEFSPEPWARVGGSMRSALIPGDHQGCVTAHVAALADAMRPILAETPEPVASPAVRELLTA